MKIYSKATLAAIFGATLLLGVVITRDSVASSLKEQSTKPALRHLPGFTIGPEIGRILRVFSTNRCQPICVGLVKTFVSPANCQGLCSELQGADKGKCIQDCVAGLTEFMQEVKGSTGRICSQAVCPFLDELFSGEVRTTITDVDGNIQALI